MIGADYFAQDPRTDKLNLTVGIYQDAQGRTPVLKAVKLAEQRLVEQQTTKSYLALTGDADYCAALGQAIMGNSYGADWVAAQTSGGAVALRVMADLLAQMPQQPTVWLQSPTYGNYVPILTAAGARYQALPYYDPIQSKITFDQMLDGLQAAKAGDVFLMQGICHNPTGADMSPEQFAALLDAISISLQRYVGVKTLISLITAGISYSIFRLLGLEYAETWAVLTFALNFIPSIGSIIAVIFPAMIALVQFESIAPFLVVVLGCGTIQFLIGNFLDPALLGRSLNMSTFLVILALMFWTTVWGLIGAFLSVPLTVCILIVFSHIPALRPVAILMSLDGRLGDASNDAVSR